MNRLLIGSFLGDTILPNYYFSRYAIIYCTRLAKKSMLNVYTFLFDWMIAKNEIVRFTIGLQYLHHFKKFINGYVS